MRRAVLLCLGLFALLTLVQGVHAAWWDPNWQYRREITISGSHPENYQLKVVLPFFDNSIRFLENENSGLLPYWVENWTADNMTVWVKRYQASGADSTIYVYYGNPNAGRVDNGWATFDFFDDFNDNTLSSDWTVWNPTVTEINSRLEVTNSSTDARARVVTYSRNDVAIAERVYVVTRRGDIWFYANSTNYWGVMLSPSDNTIQFGKYQNASWTWAGSVSFSSSFNRWYNFEARKYGTTVKVYVDGVLQATFSDAFLDDYNWYPGCGTWSATAYFDDFRVMKCLDLEPTASVGAEEFYSFGISSVEYPTEVDIDDDWVQKSCPVRVTVSDQLAGENADNILSCTLEVYDFLGCKILSTSSPENVVLIDANTKRFDFVVDNLSPAGVSTLKITAVGSSTSASLIKPLHLLDSEGYCRYENLPGHVLSVKGEVWKFENWVLNENFNDISDWSNSYYNWPAASFSVSSSNAREGENSVLFSGTGGTSTSTVTFSKTVNFSGYYKVGIFVRVNMSCSLQLKVNGNILCQTAIDQTNSWRFYEARLPAGTGSATFTAYFCNFPQVGSNTMTINLDALLLGARPSGTWTVKDNYFEDNNTGTHLVFWSGDNFTVENFSLGYVKRDGRVVLKFFLDNIDGVVENTYPYPDCPPYLHLPDWISTYSPLSPLVDVDWDSENRDYKNDNFTWGINCGDPDNDDLTVTCRTYDNNGNLAFENSVRVWWDSSAGYRTVGDNRRNYEGWFVWNPPDNSPLGTCDLWVRLDDNTDTFENTAWEVLYLDDITTTWSVSPLNPFCRWEVTISGSVQLADFRPWYSSYFPGNLWNSLGITSKTLAKENIKYLRLDDQFSGTFYPTINAPWSQTYIERATPSQIVQVSLTVICDLNPSNPKVWILDGRPGWSYTNNPNWKYAVRLMWEKGFDNLTDNQVENSYTYFVNFSYTTGATSGDNRLVKQYTEFLLPYQINWAVIKDNRNAYTRTLLDNGRRYLDFYLIKQEDIDAGKCLSYLFKIDDPTGAWLNGTARWYKWVQNQPKRFITESYWGATGEITCYLIYDETYNILLVSQDNREFEFGFFTASANRTPAALSPLLRAPSSENWQTVFSPEYSWMFWWSWDRTDNSLHLYGQDRSGKVVHAETQLLTTSYPSAVSGTSMMENSSGTWQTVFFASPENWWRVRVRLETPSENNYITYLISPLIHASLTPPSGLGEAIGSPVPLSMLFAAAVGVLMLCLFGQINAGVGIVFAGIALAVIKVLGISVPAGLIGILVFVGVLTMILERRS